VVVDATLLAPSGRRAFGRVAQRGGGTRRRSHGRVCAAELKSPRMEKTTQRWTSPRSLVIAETASVLMRSTRLTSCTRPIRARVAPGVVADSTE